ncbi:ABC-three component system protein [Lichenihabitans psoromatis]|uniref:ABC-three component system protein n=1 Tax=Lichenihabitans psoromatis TaxID=2528642 RepID=UPI0010383493|nr:ABC-three component system protein [Lichenihabitans psoromatis]
MIRTVSCSLRTFKTLTFSSGLNILLADVAQTSTNRHTRNSAGKTSLVEIIHFLLGSDATKSSVFKHEELIGHSFSVELRLGDRWVRATRSGSQDEVVTLSTADARALGVQIPQSLFEPDDVSVSVESWKAILGAHWFNLPVDRTDTEFDGKGGPTFRALASYFARRRKAGGLDAIEKSSSEQQPGSWQVSISYLVGLNWHIARQFQDMRDRKRVIEALSKAVKEGELGQIFGTTAEIRPELARAEERLDSVREQVDSFQVHESYRELADRGSALKDRASEITFALAEASSAVEYLSKSLDQEEAPAYADVERLYAAAGIELPTVALRRFDDVKAFQASVAANRRQYLKEQIDEITAQKSHLERELQDAAAERTKILQVLDGKGAFEDLIRLHEKLGELVSRAEILRSKLQHAVALENNKTQLKAQAAELELKLQRSYETSEGAIKRATVLVDHAISTLYDDRTGNLIVEASRTGPRFRIDIQGGGNKGGIDNMKVFCFDTALLRIACDRFAPGPRMLVHDSHLFDGVDSRQVARALIYGDGVANEVDGQYIVALNSDEYEKAAAISEAPLASFVNNVRLTDDEVGGLFGFRFDME